MTNSMYEVRDWRVAYPGGFHLGPLDFALAPGRILGLIGRSGRGKTTLLESMVGYFQVPTGQAYFEGKLLGPNDVQWKQSLGYVPQQPRFYGNDHVEGYLKFVARFYPNWGWAACHRMLVALGIERTLLPEELSRGRQTGLAIVTALALQPRLLLMDEPTANLDPVQRELVLGWVLEYVADHPETAVLITAHQLGDLARVVDEVALLGPGRVTFRGDRDQVEDRWRRVWFRYEGEKLQLAAAHSAQQNGDYFVVVTANYPALEKELSLHGINPREVQPMAFEEIAQHLVVGGLQ